MPLTVCPTGCDFATIGDALAAAVDGQRIRVMSGTYMERLTIAKSVNLEGGWDASFTSRTPGGSVIDAQRLGRAITILGVVSPTIDGFTITGGEATAESSGPHRGGGVYVEAGGTLLTNNVITNNLATTHITAMGYGGGVCVDSGTVMIRANHIMNNVAGAGGDGTEAYGGGVYALGTTTLTDNLLMSNEARAGVRPYGYGGGAYIVWGVVRNNRFISNTASNGGGIASVLNSTFDRNLSLGSTGSNFLLDAGGSWCRLTNNLLLETKRSYCIGTYGNMEVVNNTIVGCDLGVYVPTSRSPSISNNVFFSNTIAISSVGTPLMDHNGFWMNGTDFSVDSGTPTGTHNVFADPLFVNPAADNYHLRSTSPMIDVGIAVGAPAEDYDGDLRPQGAGFDVGADEFTVPRLFLPLSLAGF